MILPDTYDRLLRLAEARLELLKAGSFEEAAAVGEEQQRLLAELPEQAPPEAKPLLERLEALLRQTGIQANVARQRVAHDLASLRRTRPALLAYVAAPEQHRLDRRG